MRVVLSILLAVLPCVTLATPQFTQAECQMLNEQRLEIRRQLRQPYNPDHGQQLQARLKELEQLLKQHCRKPVKNPPAVVAPVQQPLL